MDHKSKIDIEKELLERLEKVAIHFEELSDLSSKFPTYTKADIESTTKSNDFQILFSCIQNEELHIFQELINLKFKVEKYFNKLELKEKEIDMVTMFKPYQIVSDFLSAEIEQKSNDIPAKKEFYSLVYKQNKDEINSNPKLFTYISYLNFKNESFPSINLILDLIKIWGLFLTHHTEIDIKEFEQKIGIVKNKHSIYSKYVPKNTNQIIAKITGQIGTNLSIKEKEKIAIERDILEKLDNIAFHYEEIDSFNKQLLQYTATDLSPNSVKNKDFSKLETRIINQENDILSNLVHLSDNIEKYLRVLNLDKKEINVVEQFKPFRIASNYVNTLKHGIKKGKKSSMIDYIVYVFNQKGSSPAQDDPFIGVMPIINDYNGDLNPSKDIIKNLITIWELFIRNHTEIKTESFKNISSIDSKNNYKSVYSCSIPDGMIVDAKKLSDERNKLDI
jgi:hypothetical protein